MCDKKVHGKRCHSSANGYFCVRGKISKYVHSSCPEMLLILSNAVKLAPPYERTPLKTAHLHCTLTPH